MPRGYPGTGKGMGPMRPGQVYYFLVDPTGKRLEWSRCKSEQTAKNQAVTRWFLRWSVAEAKGWTIEKVVA